MDEGEVSATTPSQPEPVSHLIIIGASAGGIEALTALVGGVPSNLSAPILVAQHLSPTQPSHLQEILQRQTRLPVRTVTDREALRPATIYVVPADRHVEVTDHEVRLMDPAGVRGPKPSIDRVLGSAAKVFGENLIAVILSGSGSDGAEGALRVKEQGGTVVIQNPQTASHPEMPLSLRPTSVDIVAELSAIGPLLADLVAGRYAPSLPDDDRRLRSLLDQLRARSGVDFGNYKEPTIRRRLQRRMLDTGSSTLEEYTRYLRRHPEEYQRLTSSFLIKVTDFFRDADLFNVLQEDILPGLIQEARTGNHELRLWSAGCATGEEAYSLAIMVASLLGDDLDQFTVRIFATDLDNEAINFARRGVYPASALKNVPEDLLKRYFTQLDGAYEVTKTIRNIVVFGQHDLGQRAPFPRVDLVLCRNVLIYFTPDLQRRALQLFAFALRDGGSLVLGKAETTTPLAEHFALVHARLKIYRRVGDRVLIPPTRIKDALVGPQSSTGARPALAGMERELARARARQMFGQTTAERAERVLLDLPLGVVLVDARYDVQAINRVARRLLGIQTAAVGEDLVHQAYPALAAPLRDVIDRARRGEPVRDVHEIPSLPDAPDEVRFFEIGAFRSEGLADAQGEDLVAVLVADVSERERERFRQDNEVADMRGKTERLRLRLEESTVRLHQLTAANDELATVNAVLRSTNEELLVSSEEAQAAMEEVETLNEEQQATNEELETLNEEMQATVEELNATNDDLQARSLELQELTHSLETERSRIAAVLTSMADAVLVVDRSGAAVLTNQAFHELFAEGIPALLDDRGQPLPLEADPRHRAARGEEFSMTFSVGGATPRWFEATGRPITGSPFEGGVLVIRDITDRSLRHLQGEFVALAGHELRAPLAALRAAVQLLSRSPRGDEDARSQRLLATSLRQVDLLSGLVQDLTDVTRLQTGGFQVQQEVVDLAQVVRTTVDLAEPMAEGRSIRTELSPGPVPVAGDERRLQQVLLNLLANAFRYAPGDEPVDVTLRAEDGQAVLSVRDHGPGVPPEERERIFSRYHRLERSGRGDHTGLGLGLFLVREIAQAHGGTVGVDSPPGGGAVFTVRLPLVTEVPRANA